MRLGEEKGLRKPMYKKSSRVIPQQMKMEFRRVNCNGCYECLNLWDSGADEGVNSSYVWAQAESDVGVKVDVVCGISMD